MAAALLKSGMVSKDMLDKNERLAEMNRLFKAYRQMVEERAVAYSDDPIGRLGLHNRRFRILGSREYPVLLEEYWMDHRELREFLQIMKHAAIEMGQWGKKPEDAEEGKASREGLARRLESGRQRVARAREERAVSAVVKGETLPDASLGELAMPAGSPLSNTCGPISFPSPVQSR